MGGCEGARAPGWAGVGWVGSGWVWGSTGARQLDSQTVRQSVSVCVSVWVWLAKRARTCVRAATFPDAP